MRRMRLTKLLVALASVAALGGVSSTPVFAAPSDTGSGAANFGESDGCAPGVAGPARPETWRSGSLDTNVVVQGPWGDMFGRNYYQVAASVVSWRIYGTNQTVRIHERMRPAAQQVDLALAAAAGAGLYYAMPAAAGWVWRTVGGTVRFSEHAFGTAIDINPTRNPYSRDNILYTDMPQWFVDVWRNAGFCWGGDWQSVKDAMHYSWSGPAATNGYPGRPAPYPPLTGAVPFDRVALNAATSAGGAADFRYGMGDFSGDGSPDLYRLRPIGSSTRLEVFGSKSYFGTVGLRRDFPFPLDAPVLVADYDLDGVPDIWRVDDSGASVTLRVWTSLSDYADSVSLATGVSAADDYALTLYDDDYQPDLVAVDTTGPTVATVHPAAGGYSGVARTFTYGGSTADAGTALLFGDWDVDGRTDMYVVEKGSASTVRVLTAAGNEAELPTGITIGDGTEILISDYDGDGRDDLYLRGSNQMTVLLGGSSNTSSDLSYWYVTKNDIPWDAGPECVGPNPCDSIGYSDAAGVWHLADAPAADTGSVEFYYGNPGDYPFAGDWDCDGVDTPGLYRQSDGYVYLRNSNTQGIGDVRFFFGDPGDVPVIGDFNGDGCDTVSLYRPSETSFYIINSLGSADEGLGAADFSFMLGHRGDQPFSGDFNGDGVDDVGLHRSSTGYVYLKYVLSGGPADEAFFFGIGGDEIVAGDWNGDGTDTVGLFREDDGNWYLKLDNGGGAADHAMHFHAHFGDTRPVAGYFATESG